MKKLIKFIYPVRIIMLVIHLIMLFTILGNIIDVGLFGYLFLIIEIIYVIRVIYELFTKKDCYKKDVYYNIMQIGLFSYISVLWTKLYFDNIFFVANFITYLKTNYVIISVLIVFLIFYSVFCINKKNSFINK